MNISCYFSQNVQHLFLLLYPKQQCCSLCSLLQDCGACLEQVSDLKCCKANGILLILFSGPLHCVDFSNPWTEQTLPSQRTTHNGRYLTTHRDPDITPFQVELELHVDGGGGEAGDEVVRMANNWIWKHGEKVKVKHINLGNMKM